MGSRLLLTLGAIACCFCLIEQRAMACRCASEFHGKSLWETAKLEAEGETVIFEGRAAHFEIEWDLLKAKPGDFISADIPNSWQAGPRMVITFKVSRVYKGDLGPEVRLRTALGGGDCAARFMPGLTYLVYGSGKSAQDLRVGMCSPGGWIGEDFLATELRFLRNERRMPKDSLPGKALWTLTEAQQQQRYQERRNRFAAATGRICGTVVQDKSKEESFGGVAFLSTLGYLPFDYPTAQVKEDGSFCSDRLGPGSYYLYFTSSTRAHDLSAAYYPGVSDRAHAKAIEVTAGQDRSGIVITVPRRKTHSVRGFITADDKAGLGSGDVSVALISEEQDQLWRYRDSIDFSSSLPLPRTKYFSFGSVLPGHYIVYVSVMGQGWQTKKVEVDVTSSSKFVFLELSHKKKTAVRD
jgi:hypothetical protein